jgi:Family of unknown function (DUF6155)
LALKEIKQELLKQDKATLVKHILELYKKYDSVKEYFDFYVTPDEEKILEKYKEKVKEGFYPKRGMELKLSLSRKAINDFRKLEVSKEKLGDLMLYYVECGVEYTNDFGDINESFYSSVENTFEKSLNYFEQEEALEKYKDRAEKILKDTDGIGWGFHDTIGDIYFSYYD